MARGSKKGVQWSEPMAKLTDDLLVEISTRWRDLISQSEHRKKMPQSIVGFFYEGYNKFCSPRKARYFTSPFAIPKNSVSTFLNGILNLVALGNLIVAVDVERDNWWIVRSPKPPYYAYDINGIFSSQGRLYFANSPTDTGGSELSISVLEDYVTGKWILEHSVSHMQLFKTEYSSYANDYSVISIHPERSLVFIVGGDERTLMSYDMDSMELCFICQLGSECKVEWPGCGDKTPFYPHIPLFSESLADGY